MSVVEDFKKRNIPVKAVLQLDMTGYTVNNDLTMWLESGNDVDKELTAYLETLIKTYVKRPVKMSCSGSSDEEVWAHYGYIVARPLEVDYCGDEKSNPYMHTNEDTLDKLNLTHMTDYLKLSMAFIVELAEPSPT